ncbi:MAG: septum formation initiator family protein [Patescibacteria group bacterium]
MTEQNSKWSKFFYSRWFLLIIIGAIFFAIFAFTRAYFQDYQVQIEIERLKTEAASLESKKIETLELLKYVQTPEFAEEKARTELNLTKPGEKTIIIKSDRNNSESIGQVDKKVVESNSISNPIKWWRLFTDN